LLADQARSVGGAESTGAAGRTDGGRWRLRSRKIVVLAPLVPVLAFVRRSSNL
jgi:hypothetical protein